MDAGSERTDRVILDDFITEAGSNSGLVFIAGSDPAQSSKWWRRRELNPAANFAPIRIPA
jgi:hypothetical protein